jgi:MGT family glycosyltransferase
VAEPLNRVRAENGLPADDELQMLSRYLVLSPCPPSYREPAFPLPSTAHSFNPSPNKTAPAPKWLTHLPNVATIYFTLGTIFNLESGDLFIRVLGGLRELPFNIIVTVGNHIDPIEFGSQPAHIRIERYIAQELLLPHCDLVISHGGSGSVLGALAHGLPMVLIPMGADQPLNASRCADLGVAQVLDAVTATPDSVREAVMTVLTGPGYRQTAEHLRDEMAALPGPEQAIPLFEQLVETKRPIHNQHPHPKL